MNLITNATSKFKDFKALVNTKILMRKAKRALKQRPDDFKRNRLDSNALTITASEKTIVVWIHRCQASIEEIGLCAAMCQQLIVDGKAQPNIFDIVIDEHLNAAPRKIRDAMIWHEIGHALAGHLDGNFSEKEIIHSAEIEYEADRISQLQGHDMIAAIEWMKKVYANRLDRANINALNLRIQKLQQIK